MWAKSIKFDVSVLVLVSTVDDQLEVKLHDCEIVLTSDTESDTAAVTGWKEKVMQLNDQSSKDAV